ncbi:uncharacterized protein TNCV_3627271 [Trichonephila clavipes]|nr:uncharacterized protein TNCV_3627271 [Trichonephila clavipes]
MQVKIEGYLIRETTQRFNCNNFFHTAENCHLKPRCLKCGKEHPTRQCPLKERQENPFCINCQEYGHSACYTKCPKFPKPKKGTPLTANKTFESDVHNQQSLEDEVTRFPEFKKAESLTQFNLLTYSITANSQGCLRHRPTGSGAQGLAFFSIHPQ